MGNSENTTYWGNNIPRLEDYGTDERLNVKSIKLFTDGEFLPYVRSNQHTHIASGALGSWGAALLEPYSDKSDTKGIMRTSPEALDDMVQKFWDDGWGIVSHRILHGRVLSLMVCA